MKYPDPRNPPKPHFDIGQRVLLVNEQTGFGAHMKLAKVNGSRVILEFLKEPPVKWTQANPLIKPV